MKKVFVLLLSLVYLTANLGANAQRSPYGPQNRPSNVRATLNYSWPNFIIGVVAGGLGGLLLHSSMESINNSSGVESLVTVPVALLMMFGGLGMMGIGFYKVLLPIEWEIVEPGTENDAMSRVFRGEFWSSWNWDGGPSVPASSLQIPSF